MQSKHYILAHDTGTGGDKAVLTDLQGQVIQSAYQPYEVHYPRPDWAEQDPEELWRAVAATTKQVIAKAGINPQEILGVGISAQMFNLLPVDENIKPVTPMLSWLDVRSVPQADRVLSGDMPDFPVPEDRQYSHCKGYYPQDPVAQGRTSRIMGAYRLPAGLQGIYLVPPDWKSCH